MSNQRNNSRNDRPRGELWPNNKRNPEMGSDTLKVLGVWAGMLLLIIALPPLGILAALVLFVVAIYQGIQNNS